MTTQQHWKDVYDRKPVDTVSWYQPVPERSLDWITSAAPNTDAAIIDVGAGTSSLVDQLLDRGYRDPAVLDIASSALSQVQARLGSRADEVDWFTGDVREFEPPRPFDVWHDRAVLHFLTDPQDRQRYANIVRKAVRPGGHVLIATFAHGGPTRCSGLPVMQSNCAELAELLGEDFVSVRDEVEMHTTPGGGEQKFQYCLFRRHSGSIRSSAPSSSSVNT